MKHLIALLFILLLVCPLYAQDATREPTADITLAPISIVTAEAPNTGDVVVTVNTPAAETPAPTSDISSTFVYVAFGALTLILVAVLFNIPVILKIVAPLVPLETALSLAKQITPAAADIALNEVASRTPTTLDDKLLIAALLERGYTVTGGPGTYHTVESSTLPKTATLTRNMPLDDHKD